MKRLFGTNFKIEPASSLMKLAIKFIGVIFLFIGGYFAYKVAYHLINYEITFGLEPSVFGYGRPYWEICIEFLFWLTVVIGGIGFLITKRKGLIACKYSLIVPILVSVVFLLFSISKKLKVSAIMVVNNEKREMSLEEQWNYIYSEPIYTTVLILALIAIIILTNKQIKQVM